MPEEHPPICDYEGSEYQSTFWDSGRREYEDRAEAIALRRLLPPGGKILLEVGAGAGRNTPRYTGFDRVVLLDYSRSQLRLAQKRLQGDQRYLYVAGDAYRLPFVPGLFDCATMIRTIHHMADAPLTVRQVREVLQPGGIFILEFANKHNMKAILRYSIRRQSWSPFDPDPVEFVPLNFNFHPKTVRNWLGESDFEVEKQLTVSHFRMGLLKRLVPHNLLANMDSVFQWTGDMWQLSPSVFVRARATGDTPNAATGTFFRCPHCGHYPIGRTDKSLSCQSCESVWGIKDGIIDFREPIA